LHISIANGAAGVPAGRSRVVVMVTGFAKSGMPFAAGQ
jgi:hypothetical protein